MPVLLCITMCYYVLLCQAIRVITRHQSLEIENLARVVRSSYFFYGRRSVKALVETLNLNQPCSDHLRGRSSQHLLLQIRALNSPIIPLSCPRPFRSQALTKKGFWAISRDSLRCESFRLLMAC